MDPEEETIIITLIATLWFSIATVMPLDALGLFRRHDATQILMLHHAVIGISLVSFLRIKSIRDQRAKQKRAIEEAQRELEAAMEKVKQ